MISRQLALDAYKARHAQKRGGQVLVVLDELAECISDTESGADMGESVALSDALNRFLWALPERTRNIFVRRYFYMSTVVEIARDFSMKESNVAMHLLRTRRKLAQFLEKEGFNI
jgi:RNA polymerase sigma-70 factor (ECF subfamily)